MIDAGSFIYLLPLSAYGSVNVFGSEILQMIMHAGTVVKIVLFILLVFSLISWAIIFMKARLFFKASSENEIFLEYFWEGMEFSKLKKEAETLTHSPIGHIFREGFNELGRITKIKPLTGDKDSTNPPRSAIMDDIQRVLRKSAVYQQSMLERYISFLATTGNTCPFIGLFGTVWGIMESFRGIGLKGSASLAVVAPGISEALVATAGGLAVAIPAVVAFNYFNQKVINLQNQMETFISDFLSLLDRQMMKKNI